MSKGFLGAFIVIAGVAVGAVDYINQAKVAHSKPGQFGARAYAETISGRFLSQRAELAAANTRRELLAQPMREHLPEAPEGWIRRDLTEADIALLEQRYDMNKDASVPDEFKNDAVLGGLMKASEAVKAQADTREVYVYEADKQLISLRLEQLNTANPGGIGGLGMQMVAANLRAMSVSEGYAMVGGVAFRLEQGLFGQHTLSPGGAPEYRVISGKVGEDLKITLRARAGDEAILALLQAVDYDRLNAMLETPEKGVGNDAPVLDPAASRAMAEAKSREEDRALKQQGADAEARLMALAKNVTEDETGLATIGAAAAGLETTEPSAAPAGIFGTIAGALGGVFGKSPTPAEPIAATPAPAPSGFGLGASNCQTANGVKSCSIGGN